MANSEDQRVDIWLDCDPGLDDILAIIYAALSDRFNLIGLTTSPGNSTLENTTRNALDILYHIGRSDVQVFEGSNQLINGDMKFAEHVHGENALGDVNLKVSPVKSIS
jgi:inosine-uridine nucleoside N-ribohydrolase